MKVLVELLLYILTIILHGFAILYSWQWFVVPFGIIPINYPWALGIGLLTGYLTKTIRVTDVWDKDEKDSLKDSVLNFLRPVVILVLGYIVQLFM